MDIEQQLKERYGNNSPFTIPDQYFESFESNLFEQTTRMPSVKSQRIQTSVWLRLRPLVVAASFVGICCLSWVIVSKMGADSQSTKHPHQAQKVEKTSTSATDPVDQIADYAMLDDDDVYAILADN